MCLLEKQNSRLIQKEKQDSRGLVIRLQVIIVNLGLKDILGFLQKLQLPHHLSNFEFIDAHECQYLK
jgi:hypothetical protein